MKKNGAFVVIFNRGRDKVLLVKRKDFPIWVLPGGGVEQKELPRKAAIRETNEETGFRIKVIRDMLTYKNKNGSKVVLFEGRVVGGKARVSSESVSIRYFALNQLPITLFPPHKERILDALGKRWEPKTRSSKNYIFKMIYLILTNSEWRKIFLMLLNRRLSNAFRNIEKI